MMDIAIYQVNIDRDKNMVCFMPFDFLGKRQGSNTPDSNIYDKVFEGSVSCDSLEDVYEMFNLNHPKDYRGRSLSVSDIVEVRSPDREDAGFWFCDSFGFQKVLFEPERSVALSDLVRSAEDRAGKGRTTVPKAPEGR